MKKQPSPSTASAPPNYTTAWAELQQILHEIQHETIDFEAVSQKVTRANELIEFCRAKLRHTEAEMNQLIYGRS